MKWYYLVVIMVCSNAWARDTHALLIGVSDYGEPAHNLESVKNDLVLFSDFLRERLPNVNIKTLLNEQATHSAVAHALKELQDRPPEDHVIIYFSGHGSQTKDQNGDEESGDNLDETWVTYGARRGILAGIDDYDLLDDEIQELLANMKTQNLLVVTDACHSGSATRVGGMRVVREDTRAHPAATRAYVHEKVAGIRLGAADDHEMAASFTHEDGQAYGVFTWHLVESLRRARPGDSWSDIIRRTTALIRQIPSEDQAGRQTPQVEGEGFPVNLLVGGTASERSADGLVGAVVIAIRPGPTPRLTLDVGRLSGVTEGSTFRSMERDAVLEVIRVNGFQTIAELKSGNLPESGDMLELTKRVRDLSRRFRLALAWDTEAGKPWAERLEQIVQQQFDEIVTLVDSGQNPDWKFHIRLLDDPKQGYTTLPDSDVSGGFNLWLTDGQDRLEINRSLLHLSESRWQADLERVLRICIQRWELMGLASTNDDHAPFSFRLIPCQLGPSEMPNGLELTHHRSSSTVYGEFKRDLTKPLPLGSVIAYRIHNLADRDRYFYVVNLSPDGAIHPVFPRNARHDEHTRIAPKQIFTSGWEDAIKMNQSGTEQILVLSTDKPFNVHSLRIKNPFRDTTTDPKEKFESWHGQLYRIRVE